VSQALLRRLAVVLGALVLVWTLLALVRRVTQDRNIALDLARVDTSAVDTVSLVRGRDSLVIARGADGAWRANGFPAAADAISALLQGLADSAPTTELVAESRASHERLGVAGDSSRHIRVAGRGGVALELIAGKRTADYSGGLLVRSNDGDGVYALRGLLANALDRSADDWRDKRIIATNPDSIGSIEVKRGSRSFGLKRLGAGWQLAGGGAADSAAASTLASAYREVSSSGFATKAQADSANFTRAYGRLRLATRSGMLIANIVFDSTKSGMLARADTGGVVYRVEPWIWNQIAPAESTLRAKRK
jgi:hypothetical protein